MTIDISNKGEYRCPMIAITASSPAFELRPFAPALKELQGKNKVAGMFASTRFADTIPSGLTVPGSSYVDAEEPKGRKTQL